MVMAEINIERKKSIWPWIIAALIAALLVWVLVEVLDRDEAAGPAAGAATADQTAATAPATADATGSAGATDGLARYAGLFVSDSMQLRLNADGSYTMQESAAGEGRGTWTHDAGANALHLTPADGSQDRFFRVESAGTLTPLNPDGAPAAQMSQLTRRDGE
jgi:hypothetical protein